MPLADADQQQPVCRVLERGWLTALQAKRDDTVYQYLAEAAARICGTPLAGIAVLDKDTLRFKAVVGLSPMPEGLPADSAPCLRLIKDNPDSVTVMKDACADEHNRSPLMVGGQPLCFWAAARLTDASNAFVGSMWVADVTAHELTRVQLRSLELLARQATLLMSERG